MLRRSLLPASLGLLVAVTPAVAQAPPTPPTPSPTPTKPTVVIRDQVDGVNSQRVVVVAAYCRVPAPCTGTARLSRKGVVLAKEPFLAEGGETFKTPMRLSVRMFRQLKKLPGKRVRPTLTLTTSDGQVVSRVITIKI
jgi:hypothetical protein